MKVFISHTFSDEDQELAVKLQKILAQENIDGYLAEKTKEYDLLIRDKIRKEIENSDNMIAIVTNKARESASVNQEIGYALREGIRPIIMLEKNAKTGVLTHGIEPEEFTRYDFEKHCLNVTNFILQKGSRRKISDRDKEWLRDNAYRELYNKMVNINENPDKFKMVTTNPWKELEPSAKLKVEADVRQLFEEYTNKLNIWQITISRLNQNFSINKATLGEIIKTSFEFVSLITPNGDIILDSGSTQRPHDWIEAFKFIIFDESITNERILYDKLLHFAIQSNNGHQRWLQDWKIQKPALYGYIFNVLPSLRNALRMDYQNDELQKQNDEMSALVEKIVYMLKEKIR